MKLVALTLSLLALTSSAQAAVCVLTDKLGNERAFPIEVLEEDGPFALGTLKVDGLFAQIERGTRTAFDEGGSGRSLFLSLLVNSGPHHEGEAEVNPEETSKVELTLRYHRAFKKISCEL